MTFCYVENMTEAQTADGTPAPAPLSPVEKLEKQDERNKEIALERTVEDTKKQILEADITGGKFSADEDTMLYFFLLSSLRKEHFAAVGIAENKQYITGRGQDGDYRQPHREDEDHHPQGLPCSQLQGSVREQHRGDPLA